LSIRKIAEILGINRGMVSRIKCDREPSLVTLRYTALTLACGILDSLKALWILNVVKIGIL
jgi:transcriptional regulator with XRE-family HTH domain